MEKAAGLLQEQLLDFNPPLLIRKVPVAIKFVSKSLLDTYESHRSVNQRPLLALSISRFIILLHDEFSKVLLCVFGGFYPLILFDHFNELK